jgi:transposase-like protein
MSNPFMIAAQASVSTPSSISLAPRPGPKAKPLAACQSLHALQLTRHDLTPITTTTIDGLLAQFKSNIPAELDSDSDSHDTHRRSYTREQKLAAISYAATKRVWDLKEEQMVLISHKQACRDLGLQPSQLRKWQKDVDKIRSLQKGSRKGKLSHPAQFPVLEGRLHTLILEKRQLGRKVGENWIRRHAGRVVEGRGERQQAYRAWQSTYQTGKVLLFFRKRPHCLSMSCSQRGRLLG